VKVSSDRAHHGAFVSPQPSRVGRFKSWVGDGKDKPSAGFEKTSHGAENRLQIRDRHECQHTRGAIEAGLWEGVSTLSIILKVFDAQRLQLLEVGTAPHRGG
jgi:hypothetical protein